MYKVTYEQIQQVRDNCVHSRIKVLNSMLTIDDNISVMGGE